MIHQNSNGHFKKGNKINLGRKYSKEHRKNISKSKIGHKMYTDEWRKKISINTRKAMQCPIIRAKLSKAGKGRHNSPATEYKKGNITWNTGIGHSELTKIKMRSKGKLANTHFRAFGKDNPMWKGGKSKEPYPLGFNDNLKLIIRFRDNFTCQWCGQKQNGRALHIHHVDDNKNNLDWDNLLTVCSPCHLTHHKA